MWLKARGSKYRHWYPGGEQGHAWCGSKAKAYSSLNCWRHVEGEICPRCKAALEKEKATA